MTNARAKEQKACRAKNNLRKRVDDHQGQKQEAWQEGKRETLN